MLCHFTGGIFCVIAIETCSHYVGVKLKRFKNRKAGWIGMVIMAQRLLIMIHLPNYIALLLIHTLQKFSGTVGAPENFQRWVIPIPDFASGLY
jgi:hypothetical protein